MKLDFTKVKDGVNPVKEVVFPGENTATGVSPPINDYQEPPASQPVTIRNPLDLEQAKKQGEAYRKICESQKKEAEEFTIKNDAGEAFASARMLESVKINKKLNTLKLSITEQARIFTGAINSFFNVFSDCLTEKKTRTGAIEIWNGKIIAYSTQKEFDRRKKEKAARDAVAKMQTAHNKEAEKAGVEPVTFQPPVMPRTAAPVRTDQGTVSKKMVWKVKVTDVTKLHRDYLMADIKEMEKAVAAGIRKIEGAEIYQEMKTHRRAS